MQSGVSTGQELKITGIVRLNVHFGLSNWVHYIDLQLSDVHVQPFVCVLMK